MILIQEDDHAVQWEEMSSNSQVTFKFQCRSIFLTYVISSQNTLNPCFEASCKFGRFRERERKKIERIVHLPYKSNDLVFMSRR